MAILILPLKFQKLEIIFDFALVVSGKQNDLKQKYPRNEYSETKIVDNIEKKAVYWIVLFIAFRSVNFAVAFFIYWLMVWYLAS